MSAAAALPGLYDDLAFDGAWRRYQRAALAAFERDRAAGRRRTHLVAPPGSGKTLLGVELVRRLGRRALVLAPSGELQLRWARAVRQFGAPAGTAGPDPAFPIAWFSYQSLCELEDPGVALERAGHHTELAELLSASASERVAKLRAARVGVVVLDECHRLASPWGQLVRAVLDELGDVHVIGLTATDVCEDEQCERLLGPVTFTVPTPAVVRDGHLAPYQELAWLVEPLESERRWLAEHEREPASALSDDAAFAAAVRQRAREDRLLTGSRAKELGLVEVLAAEIDARGDALRALVLCDGEAADGAPDLQLEGVLDTAAGTARHALVALGVDDRTAPLRPLLVSSRGLRCLPADADALLEALVEQAERRLALPEWEAEPEGVLVSLRSHGAEWVPRAWVELATRVLESGVSGALVGTRAMLGESWECPAVNCLVDLTVAAGGASVQQARGRSLRLDPGDPAKLASNWDIVCAAPDLVCGRADYERFARKHEHLHAPADDGEIEAGPSHVHPELGRSAPPADRFAAINAATVARAAARDGARERWRIGAPYRGVELPTLVLRGDAGDRVAAKPPPISQRVPLAVAFGGSALVAVAALATGLVALVAGLAALPAGLAWAVLRLRRSRDRLRPGLPLESAARVVADAYRELGELPEAAAGSLRIEPLPSGYVRCMLAEAAPEQSARFVAALDELVAVADAPRYLVGRPLPDPAASATRLLARVLVRRPPFPLRHHPVPSDLGRSPVRAEAFARSWRRHVGPTALVPADGTPAAGGYETFVRDVWV